MRVEPRLGQGALLVLIVLPGRKRPYPGATSAEGGVRPHGRQLWGAAPDRFGTVPPLLGSALIATRSAGAQPHGWVANRPVHLCVWAVPCASVSFPVAVAVALVPTSALPRLDPPVRSAPSKLGARCTILV